jgi:cytochrome oxidase Cu insertion factor (SCO1/SenC/PrrC family)
MRSSEATGESGVEGPVFRTLSAASSVRAKSSNRPFPRVSVARRAKLRYRYSVMETNDKAPEFTLSDENGNPVSLQQFRGKNVVLFFYPKANTPG